MTPGGLTIYKSSAGSGKTYTLVLEYLKLVLPEPHRFRQVLAVTFTNKATEEMKARIIEELSRLSRGDAQSLAGDHVYETLKAYLDSLPPAEGDPRQVSVQARRVLNLILDDYSHFAVSTIESFFQRVVRAFARELNIPLAFDLEMEQDRVLLRVIDDLMLRLGLDEDLTRLLKAFVDSQLQDDKSYHLGRSIQGLARELFKEAYVEKKLKFEGHFPENPIQAALQLAKRLRQHQAVFHQQLAKVSGHALEEMARLGVSVDDFSYKKSGVAGFLTRFVETPGKVDQFVYGKRISDALEDPTKWVAKKAPASTRAAAEALHPRLIELTDLLDRELPLYRAVKEVYKEVHSLGLLQELERQLETYRKEENTLLISDTVRLLRSLTKDQYDAPFIYEKVGTRFSHFLLDEFQDTSGLQWINFFPLVSNALSEGQDSLVVGDVKQSIYRWRNGRMELLLSEIEGQIQAHNGRSPEVKNLTRNWRTAPDIVAFNNEFFVAARELGIGLLDREQDRENLRRAYEAVVQEAARSALTGYVEVDFLEKEAAEAATAGEASPEAIPEKGWREQALSRTVALIRQLQGEGFAGQDITLLVRKNREGVELARYLQQQDIKVISAESLLISSDQRVRFLVAALQVLRRRQDELAQAALSYYFQQVIQAAPIHHAHWQAKDIHALWPEWGLVETELRKLPVYECVEELLRKFPAVLGPPNAYVQGFRDLALEYSSGHDASISGFLDWWEEEKGKRAIAAAPEADAVQILTIHKAKGLEFPIVILPLGNWDLYDHKGLLWVESPGAPFEPFPILPVSVNTNLAASVFADAYAEEHSLSFLDNLNLLYVALTRPKYRLYLFTEATENLAKLQQGGPKDIAGLLNLLLQPEGQVAGRYLQAPQRYERGQALPRTAYEAGKAEAVTPHALQAIATGAGHWSQKVRIRYSADRYAGAELSSRSGSLTEGELIHDALALIETEADIEAAVEKMRIQGLLQGEQAEALVTRLRGIVQAPEAAEFFHPRWEVRNEAEILDATGKVLRPDRVLIEGKQAVVIDYKTGQPAGTHPKQVQTYMDALREMGYDSPRGYLYYLALNRVEAIG